MCRFHCKDPETCKIPRFSIDLVKEEFEQGNYQPPKKQQQPPPQRPVSFVRNQKVQFFSPPSDSECSDDDEDFYDAMPLRRNLLSPMRSSSGPLTIGAAGVAAALSRNSTDEDNDPSYLMTSTSASSSDSGFAEMPSDAECKEECETVSLKSILVLGHEKRSNSESQPKSKRVRFADDCGHMLVHSRSIQSRLVDALFADLVEIEPVAEQTPSPWRVALLRKLFATPYTNTTSLLSLGEDEIGEIGESAGAIMPEPVQA